MVGERGHNAKSDQHTGGGGRGGKCTKQHMVSPVVGPTGWPMGGQGWEARTNGRAGQQRAITPLEGRGNVAQLNSAGGIYVLWGKGP